MHKRKIITIDEDKCNGCAECIPNCPEGALQVIDGKARLVSDLFCDGLGACIGHCPRAAISVEEREAEEYDEKKVMENIVKQGPNVIKAHLSHLKEHGAKELLNEALAYLESRSIKAPNLSSGCPGHFSSCPGSKALDMRKPHVNSGKDSGITLNSQLMQWPVQIKLVPVNAPYFDGADLLIAADCVPFAYADFHSRMLKGKVVLVGCPKLDDISYYEEKLLGIIKNNDIRSVTYVRMEVPCCSGMIPVLNKAIEGSGKGLRLKERVISIRGELLNN